MAINPHDDYEALAKLLYPSIEASGNVYYGQTRKLAIDELFDKNSGGFESYFCSHKKDDSLQYEQHFHWKLGPFSDTVKIVEGTYKDYPLAWLKYSLTKNTVTHRNILNNGEYNTYEVEYTLGQPTLYCALDGSLPNGNMYNNSNFFLEDKTLYILLYKAPVYEDIDKPLYIEALSGDIEVSLTFSGSGDWSEDQIRRCSYKYGFDYNSQTEELQLVRTVIELKHGNRVYFKCDNRPELSPLHYIRFNVYSEDENAEVAVGGNIESMAKFDETGDMLTNAYYGLFSDNSLITDASKLYIDKVSSNGCRYLFSNCSRLKTAPSILPCFELKVGCFHSMFTNCSNLENAPILPSRDGVSGCYWRMFECYGNGAVSKLNKVVCLLNQWQHSYTLDWLDGRQTTETFRIYALSNSNWDDSDESAVPQNSEIIYLDSTIYTSDNEIQVSSIPTEKYLITHGTNNENNGRGDITNKSTLANMEKSFDENNSHQMNTCNSDGSFNQEIWGYKSFCSPVQFRNGVYGEDWSIYTYKNNANSTSVVMSRDDVASASIQICKYNNLREMKSEDSIILSSVKPVSTASAATIGIESIRELGKLDVSRITLTADKIYLNGTVYGNISSDSTAKLTTPRSISGIKFDGSSDVIYYAECDSASTEYVKNVTIPNFSLVRGATIIIKFKNKHHNNRNDNIVGVTANLCVNNGANIPIQLNGEPVTGTTCYNTWQAGDTVKLVYDGTNWICLGYQKYSEHANNLSDITSSPKLLASTNVIAYTSIVPNIDSTSSAAGYSLGSSELKWNTLYSRSVCISNGSASFKAEFDSINTNQINFSDEYGYGLCINYPNTAENGTVTIAHKSGTKLNIGYLNDHINNIYATSIVVDNLTAYNLHSQILSAVSDLLSTTTPLETPRLVYIDAYYSGTDGVEDSTFAYAGVGYTTDENGVLDLKAGYYGDYSSVNFVEGDYVYGKEVHLSDGSTVNGTWEIMNSIALFNSSEYSNGRRKYFIAKRIS